MRARENPWLLSVVIRAACLICIGIAVFFGVPILVYRGELPRIGKGIIGVLAFIIPLTLATRWIFHTLSFHYPRQLVRSLTTAFVFSAAISQMIGMPVAMLTGSYAERLLGTRFALLGVFLGLVLTITCLCFLACVLARSVTCREMRLADDHS